MGDQNYHRVSGYQNKTIRTNKIAWWPAKGLKSLIGKGLRLLCLGGLLGGLMAAGGIEMGCKTQADSRTELRFACWGSAEELATFKSLVQAFEASHPNIRITLLHSPENYFQKLHILMASDLTPDVMMINSLSLPVYSQHGLLMPLDKQLSPQHGLGLDRAVFYDGALKALSRQNTLYAIPRDVSNLVVYVNLDRLKAAGLSAPSPDWTMADLQQMAQRLTIDANRDGHPEQFGLSFFAKPPLYWLPFVWSQGGQLFDSGMTQLELQNPQAVEAIQAYADLRNKAHVAPQRMDVGNATMSQLFIQGQVVMMVNGRWMVPVLREQAKFDWDVVPFPNGKKGSVVGIDASGYAIAANTAHPKESMAWVAFLSSAQAQGQWTQSGLIIPARRDVAESAVFLNPDLKPVHSQRFLSAIEGGMPTATPATWDEFSETLQLALEPVWEGQESAQAALEKAAPKLQALLTP